MGPSLVHWSKIQYIASIRLSYPHGQFFLQIIFLRRITTLLICYCLYCMYNTSLNSLENPLQIAEPEQTPATRGSEEMGDSVLLETLTKQLDEIKSTLKEKVQLFLCISDIFVKS